MHRETSHLNTPPWLLAHRTTHSSTASRLISRNANASFNRFPFNGFTYCLTLFSKFFSSFPRGTCSLSVSCRYLALDEIYHPFLGCIPKQPDSLKTYRGRPDVHPVMNGILTLTDAVFQRTCTGAGLENASRDYNSPRKPQRF